MKLGGYSMDVFACLCSGTRIKCLPKVKLSLAIIAGFQMVCQLSRGWLGRLRHGANQFLDLRALISWSQRAAKNVTPRWFLGCHVRSPLSRAHFVSAGQRPVSVSFGR